MMSETNGNRNISKFGLISHGLEMKKQRESQSTLLMFALLGMSQQKAPTRPPDLLQTS